MLLEANLASWRDLLVSAGLRAASRAARQLPPLPQNVRRAVRVLAGRDTATDPPPAPPPRPKAARPAPVAPGAAPAQPAEPKPPLPSPHPEPQVAPGAKISRQEAQRAIRVATDTDAETLLADLENLAAAQAAVTERLRLLGMGDVASSVVAKYGGPSPEDRGAVGTVPAEPLPPAPPRPPIPTPVTPAPQPPVPAPPPEVPAPAPTPTPAYDQIDQVEQVEEVDQLEEYDQYPQVPQLPQLPDGGSPVLQGSPIQIPYFSDLEDLFNATIETWNRAGIGSPRAPAKPGEVDSLGRPLGRPLDSLPPFAPKAVIKGTTLDPGVLVPATALRSVTSFKNWAESNGFDGGGSIMIDGLIAPPGGPRLSGRRSWSPPATSSVDDRGSVLDDGGSDE